MLERRAPNRVIAQRFIYNRKKMKKSCRFVSTFLALYKEKERSTATLSVIKQTSYVYTGRGIERIRQSRNMHVSQLISTKRAENARTRSNDFFSRFYLFFFFLSPLLHNDPSNFDEFRWNVENYARLRGTDFRNGVSCEFSTLTSLAGNEKWK